MSDVRTSTITFNGEPCRVMEKGEGEPIGFLGGVKGVPTWLPFLDELATTRRVVVPSLPGFPGGAPTAFRALDDYLDWLAATLDVLQRAGLAGADLVACSMAGMLAADIAALSPATIRRLVLVAPWGLYDTSDPGPDYFAQVETAQPGLLSSSPDRFAAAMQPGPGSDPLDWKIEGLRALEAAARLSWPFGDRGLRKRIHLIAQPTLIVWGQNDRMLAPSYAKRFADGISGPSHVVIVPGAGHECVIDEPEVVAGHVQAFLAEG